MRKINYLWWKTTLLTPNFNTYCCHWKCVDFFYLHMVQSHNSTWKKQLERVVHMAAKIIGLDLTTVASIYHSRLLQKAHKILTDYLFNSLNYLFKLLPFNKRLRSIKHIQSIVHKIINTIKLMLWHSYQLWTRFRHFVFIFICFILTGRKQRG